MRSPLAALVLCLAGGACTSGTTRATQRAWENALKRPNERGAGDSGAANPNARHTASERDPWRALSQFAVEAIDLVADGSTTVSLPTLAEKLCADPREALAEDPSPSALRCDPKASIAPLGHSLELELGQPSTIGLFAKDLSDDASAKLLQQTLRQLTSACQEPWSLNPSRADNAHEEFHTCPTGSGAVLVLGRFPSNLGAGTWQVSLTVLGPG